MNRRYRKWWCNIKLKVFYILCIVITLVYEIQDFDWNGNTVVMYDVVNRFSSLSLLQRVIIVELTNMMYQVIVPTLIVAIVLSIVLGLISSLTRYN